MEVYSKNILKDCSEDIIEVEVIGPTRNLRLLNYQEYLEAKLYFPDTDITNKVFLTLDFPIMVKYKYQYLFINEKDIVFTSNNHASKIITYYIKGVFNFKLFSNNPIQLELFDLVIIDNNIFFFTDINYNLYLTTKELRDIRLTINGIDSNLYNITKKISYDSKYESTPKLTFKEAFETIGR